MNNSVSPNSGGMLYTNRFASGGPGKGTTTSVESSQQVGNNNSDSNDRGSYSAEVA